MSAVNEISKSWVENELIPNLRIHFQKSPVSYKISSPPDSYFLSRVFFLDLKFDKIDEKSELNCEYNLVVKQPTRIKLIFETLKIDNNFYNEILFFKKISQNSADCPKCFYAAYNPPFDSIIVTENIIKQGYKMNPEKSNLSMKYILATVKAIGRFHAEGYIFKEKNPGEFFEITKDIRSLLREENVKFSSKFYVNIMGRRILNYLRQCNDMDNLNLEQLEPYLMDVYEKIVLNRIKPLEPLATLCHGDVLINNVFFKEEGQTIKAKLFDFGAIGYHSPSHDLVKFLALNCPKEARTTQFNEIFVAYHETLIECLRKSGVSNLEIYTKEKLLQDFKSHALASFFLCAFFLVTMLKYEEPDLQTYFAGSEEEVSQFYLEVGGDEFSKSLVDVFIDLRQIGCLDFIFNRC